MKYRYFSWIKVKIDILVKEIPGWKPKYDHNINEIITNFFKITNIKRTEENEKKYVPLLFRKPHKVYGQAIPFMVLKFLLKEIKQKYGRNLKKCDVEICTRYYKEKSFVLSIRKKTSYNDFIYKKINKKRVVKVVKEVINEWNKMVNTYYYESKKAA